MKKSIGSGRGSVYNILLKSLQTGDKYGYEICKEVEEKTNGSYILKQPSLYSGLKRLEAQGDITSYWRDSALGGRRHYYSLTEKGRDRINRSNFSWTDARDDIVGTLFEMSETDKQIENVTNEFQNLKSVYDENQSNEKIFDEVIKRTDDLILQNKQENTEKVESEQKDEFVNFEQPKTDTQADDLFSIFNNFDFGAQDNQISDQEQENIERMPQEKIENAEFKEVVENQLENSPFDENKETESIETQIQKNFENKKNLDDSYTLFDVNFDEINQDIKEVEEDLDKEQEFEIENKPEQNDQIDENGQISLFSILENNENIFNNVEQETKTENPISQEETVQLTNNFEAPSQNIEQDIENKETENFDNILSNLQTNQEENKISTLQKNNENVLDEYFNSHISFGGFSDSTQLEEPEQNFSIYDDIRINNLFDDEKEENKEKNFENSKEIIDETDQHNDNEVQKQTINTQEAETTENKIETEKAPENKTFDYRDIFGDLVSSGQDNADETTKESENDTAPSFESVTKENALSEGNKKDDELPRIDAKNDINRTLFFDSKIVDITNKTFENSSSDHNDFESYDQTPFETDGRNPFEKYDSYVEPEKINANENINSQQFVHNDYVPKVTNVSFDRKYANNSNSFDVPDYEVRYHKKIEPSKNSKFLSINKLNLLSSTILFLFVYFAITLTLVLSIKNASLPGFQIAVYTIGYILGLGLLIKDFVKFAVNKNKKSFGLNKNEKLNNFAIAIVVALLSICINLIARIDFGKFACFSGGFMIPIYFAIALILKFPIKKFLSGFGNFYN